jgi:hypothetical protein
MNAVFQGLAMWHGLKALVAGAVVVAFLVTLGAPAQRARHQAEVKAAARPAAAHPFGRMLQRATCKLGG